MHTILVYIKMLYCSLCICITDKPAPMITHLVPAAEGSMLLAWDVSHYSEKVKGILGFVVQWQQSPMHLQWKRLEKDSNFTFLQGKSFPKSSFINLNI